MDVPVQQIDKLLDKDKLVKDKLVDKESQCAKHSRGVLSSRENRRIKESAIDLCVPEM